VSGTVDAGGAREIEVTLARIHTLIERGEKGAHLHELGVSVFIG
jgi:hypothetical protein